MLVGQMNCRGWRRGGDHRSLIEHIRVCKREGQCGWREANRRAVEDTDHNALPSVGLEYVGDWRTTGEHIKGPLSHKLGFGGRGGKLGIAKGTIAHRVGQRSYLGTPRPVRTGGDIVA